MVARRIQKGDVEQPTPAELVSLTENDVCLPIADIPALKSQVSRGVISNGQPTYCGGNSLNTMVGTRGCWRYNEWADSWTHFSLMNEARYAHGIIGISQSDFMVLGKKGLLMS